MSPTISEIQDAVCKRYMISLKDMCSETRVASIARPRQVGMYLARKHTPHSAARIAERFRRQDHTTVLSACKNIQHHIIRDPLLLDKISDIESTLEIRSDERKEQEFEEYRQAVRSSEGLTGALHHAIVEIAEEHPAETLEILDEMMGKLLKLAK